MKKEVVFSVTPKELDGIIGAFEFWISGKAIYDWAIPIWEQKYVEKSIAFLKTYLSKEVSPVLLIFSESNIWYEFTGILIDITSHCDNLPKEYYFVEDMYYDRIMPMEERGELPESW